MKTRWLATARTFATFAIAMSGLWFGVDASAADPPWLRPHPVSVARIDETLASYTPAPNAGSATIDWRATASPSAAVAALLRFQVDGSISPANDLMPVALSAGASTGGTKTIVAGFGVHDVLVELLVDTGKTITVPNGPGGVTRKPVYDVVASQSLQVNFYRDEDQDGIDDALEAQLLQRFTPYLRFSLDGGVESYRPMDAYEYVSWSELQKDGDEGKGVLLSNSVLITSPLALISPDTDLTVTRYVRNDRFLNPLKDVPKKGGNWARYGFAWNDVLANRNIGLYGHVTSFAATQPQTDFLQCDRSTTPSTDNNDYVLCNIDPVGQLPRKYYKVEYWQFFGYNGQGQIGDIGDHESDWTTVQVVVDAATMQLVQVHHSFHGYRAIFDLRMNPNPLPTLDPDVVEYRGSTNYDTTIHFDWRSGHETANKQAALNIQNNVVRLFRDPDTGEYSHPVVYVENGGHEFWPTNDWSFESARKHGGDDAAHSYLAATPPNLGEVEHPMGASNAALLILRYNGKWGAYSRKNSPPQGPPLHDQWTWPANSSIRWLYPKELGK